MLFLQSVLGNHFINCQQTRLGARSPAHRKNRGQRGESPSGTDALLTWLPGIGQPERGVRREGGSGLGSGKSGSLARRGSGHPRGSSPGTPYCGDRSVQDSTAAVTNATEPVLRLTHAELLPYRFGGPKSQRGLTGLQSRGGAGLRPF